MSYPEIRANLRYGQGPVPRCPDKRRLSAPTRVVEYRHVHTDDGASERSMAEVGDMVLLHIKPCSIGGNGEQKTKTDKQATISFIL